MRRQALFIFLAVLTLCRMAWVFTQLPDPHETYHWLCAARLAPAFYDGPAGTALVVHLAGLLGGPPLLFVRLFWPLLALVASLLASHLVLRMKGGESAALWASLLLNILPAYNMAAVTVGPEMPVLGLILAGVLCVCAGMTGRPSAWIPAGLTFALGVLFSYTAILIPLVVVLTVLWTMRRRTRQELAGAAWVAAVCALAMVPALRWNAALDWVPIAGGTLRSAWAFDWAGFGLALSTWPTGAAGAVLGVCVTGWLLLQRRGTRESRLLARCAVVALALWIYGALRGQSSPMPWLLGLACASPVLAELIVRRSSAQALGWACVVLFGLISLGALQMAARERSAWPSLAEAVTLAAREMPASNGDGFFIAESPDAAAMLAFLSGRTDRGGYPPVFVPESPAIESQFALWPSYADFLDSPVSQHDYFTEQKGVNPYVDRHAIFVGSELPQAVSAAFAEVRPLRVVRLPDGRPVTIHLCLDYQTLPL